MIIIEKDFLEVYPNVFLSSQYKHIYIYKLHFPSTPSLPFLSASFDRSGRCIAYELSRYYGTIGFLHVEEDFRGQGLGKVITSRLAHKYFSQGLPVAVVVFVDNEVSIGMHTKLGFKVDGELDCFTHFMGDPDEQEQILHFG